MDFSLAQALSGFTSSAEAKSTRQNDFAIMQNIYQQEQQRLNTEAGLQQDLEAYKNTVAQLGKEISSGSGIREKDQEAYKMLVQDAQLILKDEIAKSGSISKFMQGGGSQKLSDFKNAVTGSDLSLRLENNGVVFKKMIEASQDPETAHLIPESFLSQVSAYQSGQIDEVSWSGLLSDYDWDVQGEYQKDTEISSDMLLSTGINYQIAAENFQKDRGWTQQDFASPEEYDIALKSYVDNKYGTMYGTQEISANVSSEIQKIKFDLDPLAKEGFKYDNLYTVDDAGNKGTFKDAFEVTGSMGILENTIGYDQGWEAGVYKGKQIRSAGSWGEPYKDEIASIIWGDDYDAESGTISNQANEGYFLGGDGRKFGSGVDANSIYEGSDLGDLSDLHVRGYTIGLKISGYDPSTGEYIENLIVDDVNNPDHNRESYAKFEGMEVKQVYLAEILDVDGYFGSLSAMDDDLYYKEINIDVVSRELDKKLEINEELTEQRKSNFNYAKKENFENQKVKRQQKIEDEFLKTYVLPPEDGKYAGKEPEETMQILQQIRKKFIPSFDNKLFNLAGPDNNGEFMNVRPHLFTFMLQEAKAKNPDDIGSEMNLIINSLDKYNGTPFGEVIKGGDVNNFYQFLKNNGYNTKELRKESRNINQIVF